MHVEQRSTGPYVIGSPVDDARLTSPFGPRPPFNAGSFTTNDFHFGIDLVPTGVPVEGWPIRLLGEDGTSIAYDNNPLDGNGLVVRLRHAKYETEYMHTRPGAWRPPAGHVVKKGQTFAEVGNSGASSGAHLHLVLKSRTQSYTLTGYTGTVYTANHLDPLSDEGLAFFNGSTAKEWTNTELRAFAVTAVARKEYKIEKRNGQNWLVVETRLY